MLLLAHLVVKTVAAGDELPECPAPREPGLQVQLLSGRVVQSPGHDAHNPVGDLQQPVNID